MQVKEGIVNSRHYLMLLCRVQPNAYRWVTAKVIETPADLWDVPVLDGHEVLRIWLVSDEERLKLLAQRDVLS